MSKNREREALKALEHEVLSERLLPYKEERFKFTINILFNDLYELSEKMLILANSKLNDKDSIFRDVQSIREQMRSLSDYQIKKLDNMVTEYWRTIWKYYKISRSIEKSLKIPMLHEMFKIHIHYLLTIQDKVLWLLKDEIDLIKRERKNKEVAK